MKQMSDRNNAILKKIKGLLAIANDNKSDEESQTAFIMAQKLMIKHDISLVEVEEDRNETINIQTGQVTAHKKLYWWEIELAIIMAKNFRVKNYINWKYVNNSLQKKKAIMFLGYDNDVELAKEMYILAYDALVFYSNKFIDEYYEDNSVPRLHRITNSVKNSYINGFLTGLKEKFEEQVSQMQDEYGLMVLVPKEVEEEFEILVTGKAVNFKTPPIQELNAYNRGFNDGNKIDYTKKTINDVLGKV